MSEYPLYAVITGDIVESSKVKKEYRGRLLDTLKESFSRVNEIYPDTGEKTSFDIYRGDSFQGLIPDPVFALTASLVIRASMRMAQPGSSPVSWDARTAIGIGGIDHLPEKVSEGDGEAYRRSGPLLDKMKTGQRLIISTPWDEINNELNTQSALLDAVIAKWSPQQAEIVLKLLEDKSRKEIGSELDISQAAVHYRVKGSGWNAVEGFLERYKAVVKERIR